MMTSHRRMGIWDQHNNSDDRIEVTHLECDRNRGVCLEADAEQMMILGAHASCLSHQEKPLSAPSRTHRIDPHRELGGRWH